jgi:altronate dehydratase
MKKLKRPAVLIIHPRDNVAVALQDLSPGAAVNVRIGGRTLRISVLDPIPANHKLALTRIRRGASVVKYGEPIGEATAPIRPGAHVHIHNVRSRRIHPSKG